MMTPAELAVLVLFAYAFIWLVSVIRSASPETALKTFGPRNDSDPGKKSRILTREQREALFYAAVQQQKAAFGVLVLAVVIGIVLGAALLGRIILSPALDLGSLGRAGAIAGDLALCHYANRMNREASARVTRVVNQIGKLE